MADLFAPALLRSRRLAIGFSCVGHFMMHVLTALYLTIVLFIASDWPGHSYAQLLDLWIWGSLMIGLGAPLAGHLSDRWSESGMMAVFYLLTGAGSIAAGLVDGPDGLVLALIVLGLGGAIYHPVGIPWAMRNSECPGQINGIVGIFGAVGIGLAALIAGGLTDAFSWRWAFIVPGLACVAAGLVLVAARATGHLVDLTQDLQKTRASTRGDRMRAFLALSMTMFAGGLVFQGLQVAMPKLVEEEMPRLTGGLSGLFGLEEAATAIGLLVSAVYLISAGSQMLGGALADRMSPRRLYVILLTCQVPVLALAAVAAEAGLLLLATTVVFLGVMSVPVENLLLQRYTPAHRRGLLFGAKFILAFGCGPLATMGVARIHEGYGVAQPVFWALAALAIPSALAALWLPRGLSEPLPTDQADASRGAAPGAAAAGGVAPAALARVEPGPADPLDLLDGMDPLPHPGRALPA